MKLSDAFPSKFLKADDLGDDDVVVTIRDIRFEKVNPSDPSPKIIAEVTGNIDGDLVTKDFVVNKTNAKTIAGIHGDDTDEWEGKRITLYSTEVEYQGETMLGIRVRLKAPKSKGKGPIGAEPARAPADADDDSDIPF